jgi:LysM domain
LPRASITAIVALNHIANADRLTAGQQLKIPLAPPLKLAITPSTGPQGEQFKLTLTGAQPSETITFEIRSPKGVFRGPPHTASPDGTVTATYQPALAGKYSVIAHGSEGTAVPTTLVVLASTVSS